MLTLQELKQIVDVPYPGMKIPTAKKLKEYGTVIAKKSMGCETEILAFQNGYALYQVSRFTSVVLTILFNNAGVCCDRKHTDNSLKSI